MMGHMLCAVAAMAPVPAGEPADVRVVRIETAVHAPANLIWDAVRDVYAVDVRLVPGMVTSVQRTGDVRTVTFANGFVVNERIVGIDEHSCRITYSALGSRASYHVATMQVVAEGRYRSKVIWETRFLPAELESFITKNMQASALVMKEHLEKP